jgi:hypothetical protein
VGRGLKLPKSQTMMTALPSPGSYIANTNSGAAVTSNAWVKAPNQKGAVVEVSPFAPASIWQGRIGIARVSFAVFELKPGTSAMKKNVSSQQPASRMSCFNSGDRAVLDVIEYCQLGFLLGFKGRGKN